MWSEQKRNRLHELREKEAAQGMTEVERAELEGLFAELDAEEAVDLSPGMARIARETDALRTEKASVEAWARDLKDIVDEQQNLLAEARAYAGRLRVRRAALADEARRLKAG